jgi:replicative DNA helicase
MAKAQSIEPYLSKPLPQSREAEMAVLGAILAENAAYDDAAVLKSGDFFHEQHRTIFQCMQAMIENSEVIDVVTLPDRLYGMGMLDKAGGLAYLNQIVKDVTDASHIRHYVGIVRKKAMLRRVIEVGDFAQTAALENNSDAAESIVDQVLASFMDIASDYADERLSGSTPKQSWKKLMEGLENNSTLRVFTGIHALDGAVGGFRAGELVTITASITGSGKTLLAQQIKRNNCKNGRHGIYFSGEMSDEQLESREAATEACIPHWKMRQPEHLTESEYSALVALGATECEICRTIDGDFSIRDIRIACRRMKRTGKLSWVVIDYDELVDAPGKDEFAQQRIVTREAKRIAVSLKVPVLMISGIRKSNEKESKNSKPTLDRVYGSGAKVKHSTFVIFVDRKWVRDLKGNEAEAHIWILEAREGKPKDFEVVFNTHKLRFEDKVQNQEFPEEDLND